MTDTKELKEDIAYIRAAADRSDTNLVPSIYLLWAVIALCGFALVDFVDDYRWIGRVLGRLGASRFLPLRVARHAGKSPRRAGRSSGGHSLEPSLAGVHGGRSARWGARRSGTLEVVRIQFALGPAPELDVLPSGCASGTPALADWLGARRLLPDHALLAWVRVDHRRCHRRRRAHSAGIS